MNRGSSVKELTEKLTDNVNEFRLSLDAKKFEDRAQHVLEHGVGGEEEAHVSLLIPSCSSVRGCLCFGSYTVYVMEITHGAKHWTLSKRYSDLHRFYREMVHQKLFVDSEFPGKTWWCQRRTMHFLDSRRLALQRYFQLLFTKYPFLLATEYVERFLRLSEDAHVGVATRERKKRKKGGKKKKGGRRVRKEELKEEAPRVPMATA